MTLIGEVRWKRSNIYGLESRVHIDMNCRNIKELNKDQLTEEDCTELKAVPVINISDLLKGYRAFGTVSFIGQNGPREEYATWLDRFCSLGL